MSVQIWSGCLLAVLALLHGIYNRFLHPLADIPGPFWASISPLWLAWQAFNQRRPRLDMELHERYGKVVRIRPNEVLFSNPEYFKPVHGAGSKFVKGWLFDALTDGIDQWSQLDMVAERNLDKLRLQKRHAGTVYSTANIKKHEGLIDITIDDWFKRLRAHANQPLDFNNEMNILLADNQTRISFGRAYGAIAKGSEDHHSHNLYKMWRWWGWTGLMPWLSKLDKRIGPWNKPFRTQAWAPLPILTYAKNSIIEYTEAPKDTKRSPTILNDLMELSQAQPRFLPTWAASLAATNVGAGIDTTSWVLAVVVASIVGNRQILEKVHTEIRTAVKQGHMTKEVPVSYDAAVRLSYLQSCIQEGLRMYPSVEGLVRVVPTGGMEIDGFRLPAGTEVTISSRVLGRSEAIFGPEPEQYRPERWLEADKDRLKDMTNKNLSFGGPSRKCPGIHLAWVSMSKILASFFLHFDVELLNKLDGGPGPGGNSWREYGRIVTIWEGMEVSIKPRMAEK